MAERMKILLVEDNSADADLTCEALRECKVAMDVSTVIDGVEALKYLRHEPPYENAEKPDVVLLDLNLPKKDGREVLEEIKTSLSLKAIPVGILTTSDAETDIRNSYRLGANFYITKPVGLNEFFDTIRTVGDFWLSVVKLPVHERLEAWKKQLEHDARMSAAARSPQQVEISVLLIEDNPADADYVKEILRDNDGVHFTIETVGTLQAASERLKIGGLDAVIADLGLPDSQGLETFKAIQAQAPNLPIVVLSGLDDSDVALNAVRVGAQDYLCKNDIDPGRLNQTIRYAIERKCTEMERERLLAREQAAVLARDEFLSIASHELKTPLTALMLQTQLFSRSCGKDVINLDNVKKIATASEKQIGRLVQLVDNLLDVSRINTGRLQLHFEMFDLRDSVTDVVERLKYQLEMMHCAISLDMKEPVMGTWDRSRIDQIVLNLISNAMKYGAGVPITVFVGMENDKAVLTVEDHGIGIPKEACERIFGQYERAVEPGSNIAGLGLGLYIVRQIVDAHCGSIHVASEPGKRTTFRVELPLTRRE
jgi:signal transduction histidine kinase